MREIHHNNNHITMEFDSLEDLADYTRPYVEELPPYVKDPEFCGVESDEEAYDLARNGWDAETDRALTAAESAIEHVEREHDMTSFRAVWDVAGAEVDVARYLSGEPENMIDYEIINSPRAGRVISLCVSVVYSAALSTDTVEKRGHAITALVLAISQLGYEVELWADSTTILGSKTMELRTLVKGPNDVLDPAKIMFAYAHPAMLRVLCFAAMHGLPKSWHRAIGVGASYGKVNDPIHNLPEGTIYIPSVRSHRDVPDADVALTQHLRTLGIVE